MEKNDPLTLSKIMRALETLKLTNYENHHTKYCFLVSCYENQHKTSKHSLTVYMVQQRKTTHKATHTHTTVMK